MRLAAGLASLTALAIAGGCSSGSSSHSSASSGDGGAEAASDLVVGAYSMEQTVGANQEIFLCQFVTLPSVAGFMVKGQHEYTPGSHHLLLYTTDLTTIPPGGDQVQQCYENGDAGDNVMSHVRGVLYAGQTPMGSEALPPSVGVPTTASQVLLFQVHYLNATAASLDAKVNVQISIDPKDDIVTKAGIFFFYDPFIDVPAGAMAKASERCLISSDVTLISASSHYHSRGVNYGAYLDPGMTDLATTPFYTSDSWESPPNQQMSMHIPGGSRLRFECDYDNTSGTQAYYQGQSALDNEMCMFIGTYYPEISPLTDFCISGPDMYGTGTATCSATLSCLESCGAITVGGGIGGSGISGCEQACVVSSCPYASDGLVPVVECLNSSCSSECKGTQPGPCQQCLEANCASAISTCNAQGC